ncbi:uncharacterized protein ATNIH1004_006091 [Aspergillus tanneri]|uniref:Inner kinetochore subunit AME1 domain-containing protein n=1 Tax=Aspergillus tanneri TaxID=1220188 RepID=A0A5M9MK61_9EURO|nr:uncharacterized protein ATNIH1004_006091 [Aspergillus tanneri]KAA8647398.1 hypothetical protein ATNIH1004_006091 [Aspergillus tanneri]
MNSTREERLQMRQRGAATRKIKEVDFGFSFGAPPPEELSQPSSQPTEPPAIPTSLAPKSSQPPPVVQERKTPPPQTQESSEQAVQRTPGTARNALPERPSTFDVSGDEAPDLGRSSKRRKIEPPAFGRRISRRRDGTRQGKQASPPLPNGTVTSSLAQPPIESDVMSTSTNVVGHENQPPEANAGQNKEQALRKAPELALEPAAPVLEPAALSPPPSNELNTSSELPAAQAPGSSALAVDVTMDEQTAQVDGLVKERGDRNSPGAQPASQPNGTSPSDTGRGKRKRRGISAGERPPQSTSSPPTVSEDTQQSSQPTSPKEHLNAIKGKRKRQEPSADGRSPSQSVAALETPGEATKQLAQTPSPEPSQNAPKGKRKRRESSADARSLPESAAASGIGGESPQLSPARLQPPKEIQDTAAETASQTSQRTKRLRPQKSAQESPTGEQLEESRAGPVRSNPAEVPSRPRQELRSLRNKKAKATSPKVLDANEEPADQRAPVRVAPEADTANHEDIQPRQASKEKGKGLKRAGRVEKKSPSPPEVVEVPRPGRKNTKQPEALGQEQEPDREPEPEPKPEQYSAPKRGRGRPSLSKKSGSTTTQAEEWTAQEDADESASRPTRRKPRQPRGETVPVTVHRLANAASLGGDVGGSDSEEGDESDEELSTRQRTKLPNRGGVNVADVLSQICRETLDKTLTTLTNGISNEGNAARRSEWSRKKKAVEAYRMELESRLFELSELLDSNFMLGVQLRKAKREMMDKRSRLFQVRKEREAVALQMDAVRKKHREEEDVRAARSTINHSLHNLDLVLERSKNRTTDENEEDAADSSPTVGLEFMLRTVAESASSRAPGAHGGLLNQIKAFNAQLESAAQKLES